MMILASALLDCVAVAAIAWLVRRWGHDRAAALEAQRATLERLRVDLAELVGEAERRAHELEAALAARERRLRTLLAETGRVEVEMTAPPRLAIDPAEARLLRNLQDG